MSVPEHWQAVYQQKAPDTVSWYQPEAALSHALIASVAPARDAAIIDVGGGASTLVDALLASGYTDITVLDIAPAALERARARLGERHTAVSWQAGDVLELALPAATIDVWHDRAVFHFLVESDDRARYLAQVRRALKPGGHVVIATFAEDGPQRCSGLPVARYSAEQLHAVFGADFRLEATQREAHVTPGGSVQQFTYCVLRWQPRGDVAA